MTKILIAAALSMVSISVSAYQFPEIDQANCVERELPHYFIMKELINSYDVKPDVRINSYVGAVSENLTACEITANRIPAVERVKQLVVGNTVFPGQVIKRTYICLPVRLCHFDQHE